MNLKNLTENRYTLNDIFTKNYQAWAVIPLLVYLFTPIVHMIVYSICFDNRLRDDGITKYFITTEMPGDYYVSIIQYAFFLGAIFTFVALLSYLSNKDKKCAFKDFENIPMLLLVIYVVLIIVSTIVNKTNYNYIVGYTGRGEGVLSLLCYYLVYYLSGSLIKKEKYKYFLMYLFLLTGIVIAILTLINKYVTDINIISNQSVCGIFYHFNFYSYYLSINISMAAASAILVKKKALKVISIFSLLINIFMMSINDSLGGFLATIVALLFLAVFLSIKNKKVCIPAILIFVFFIASIFVIGLFTTSYFSQVLNLGKDVEKIVVDSENAGDAGTARWTLWTHTVQYIKEKPWIGWGFEGTAERLGTETHSDKAHNEYLENMAYFGIPAGIIYVLGLGSVYLKALIRKKTDNATICCMIGALAYICSAFVGNSFIFMAPFCFIFLGLGNNSSNENDEAKVILDVEDETAENSPELSDVCE